MATEVRSIEYFGIERIRYIAYFLCIIVGHIIFVDIVSQSVCSIWSTWIYGGGD